MRLCLPYGKTTCPDGMEVLFNREYLPIWGRYRGKPSFPLDPFRQYSTGSRKFFFKDSDAPWINKQTFDHCLSILEEWGVMSERPAVMLHFPAAIMEGNINRLTGPEQKERFAA
jgi:hypothetical protein